MRRSGMFFSFFAILLQLGRGGMIPDDDGVFLSFFVYDLWGRSRSSFNAAVLFLVFLVFCLKLHGMTFDFAVSFPE
jgi:hypothetical protein